MAQLQLISCAFYHSLHRKFTLFIQIHSKKSETISKTSNLTDSKRHSKYLASMLKVHGK